MSFLDDVRSAAHVTLGTIPTVRIPTFPVPGLPGKHMAKVWVEGVHDGRIVWYDITDLIFRARGGQRVVLKGPDLNVPAELVLRQQHGTYIRIGTHKYPDAHELSRTAEGLLARISHQQ